MGPYSVSLDLLRRFDRPGPRYTSYPTAVEFGDDVGATEYGERLAHVGRDGGPVSLYVHLPFCQTLCDFCACTAMATPHDHVRERYLGYLSRELALIARQLGRRPELVQLHLGGGTPTYFSPAQLERLHLAIGEHFDIEERAAQSLEADPRITTREFGLWYITSSCSWWTIWGGRIRPYRFSTVTPV